MMDRKAPIMAHMVAWYPDKEKSLSVSRAFLDGGVSSIEVQFPFSDPTADGPAIQEACTRALEAGFSVVEGFSTVLHITRRTNVPVFIMSYASPVFAYSVERFVLRAKEVGAAGLIVPDLMPGSDEDLYKMGEKNGLPIVPVVVPSMRDGRFGEIASLNPKYIYAALRGGITGTKTDLTSVSDFLEKVKRTGAEVFAGFGIQQRSQIEQLRGKADMLVIGSAFVNTVRANAHLSENHLYNRIKSQTEQFVYGA